MANDRLFIVRNASGEEMGPADEQTIVKWAEAGTVTLESKIRSTLVNKWDPAVEFEPIKKILKAQLADRVEKKNNTLWNKIKARIYLKVRDFDTGMTNGLVRSDSAAAPTAPIPFRIAAALTDWLIIAVYGVILYLICAWCFANKIIGGNSIFYVGFLVYWISILVYFIFGMALRTQTPGQHCWGIYLIRNDGESFWIGRVFFYVLFMFPFGLFSPLFIYMSGSGRSLQEILTRTRMVKIVLERKKR